MAGNELIKIDDIKSRIFTIRGMQVMLDIDLAEFYQVETRIINQVVKRNKERFPQSFNFILTNQELSNLKSQFVISSWGGRRTNPYAFTEAGVAMLSAVLRSSIAIKMSVLIIEAFVAMRHFISENAAIFQRLSTVEVKQIEADKKFDIIFKAMENDQLIPKQGVLFEGQVFDAHKFVSDIVRSAEKSIILIDNYVDDTVLTLFSKRKHGVVLKILTKNLSKQLQLDTQKFNEQFPPAEIKEFNHSHDRFMIIDDRDLYHFGASLKDLGKKWFGFSKMDIEVTKMLARI
ncbi:MAG TPA: ORF6N domain-containing protein [bacterium]|nr:ORF6N domain-containing protein [bacterium]HQN73964.1 ORF6N domain-containing protein [bacterium]HQO92548.1 ORF6N domain-containing protein [bacterium]